MIPASSASKSPRPPPSDRSSVRPSSIGPPARASRIAVPDSRAQRILSESGFRRPGHPYSVEQVFGERQAPSSDETVALASGPPQELRESGRTPLAPAVVDRDDPDVGPLPAQTAYGLRWTARAAYPTRSTSPERMSQSDQAM
jgi:hypothetical protein